MYNSMRKLIVPDNPMMIMLQHNLPRPDVVEKILEFIESGPCWRFHGFCRALALTDQSDLIPQGGLEQKVYAEGAPPKHLPKNLVKCKLHSFKNTRFSSLVAFQYVFPILSNFIWINGFHTTRVMYMYVTPVQIT